MSSRFITNTTIKNEVEYHYTFDFPKFNENQQKKMFFFYGIDEKAYRRCFKKVNQAYLLANYALKEGYGHLTYSMKNANNFILK